MTRMSGKPEPDLIRRQRATSATLAKYRFQPFDWKQKNTCVHLAHFHLRQMGHRPPALPRIRGVIGAKRIMGERGWADCAALLDAQNLTRINAAEMLAGDLAYRSSEDGLGGILICLGPHKLMGWVDNEESCGLMVVLDMSFDQVEACWRV